MNVCDFLGKRLDELERDRTGFPPPRGLRYGGFWLGIPLLFILGGLCVKYERHYLDDAGSLALWVGFVLVATAFVFACSVYQRRIPIKVQLVVDLVAWLILVWVYFHFRFWEP